MSTNVSTNFKCANLAMQFDSYDRALLFEAQNQGR